MAILRFLNNTSLFVAFGALFTYVFGVLIAHEQIIVTHALYAFFLTWCAYQFIKPVDSTYRKIYMLVSCTGACFNAYFLPLHFLIPGLTGFALTLLYKNDWRDGMGVSQFELRSRGWLKCLSTALAWTLVTSWWMIVRIVDNERPFDFMMLFTSQLVWIAALALAGDLRDADIDHTSARTLPAQWGETKTRIVCTVLMMLSALLICTSMKKSEPVDMAYIVSFHVLAAIMIWRISGRSNWHRATILLDSLLVFKGVVAFLILMV